MRPPQCAVWVQRKQGCPCRGAKTVVLPRGHTRGLCLLPRPDTLQCSCLENPMDRGAWRATVHGVTKSQS